MDRIKGNLVQIEMGFCKDPVYATQMGVTNPLKRIVLYLRWGDRSLRCSEWIAEWPAPKAKSPG